MAFVETIAVIANKAVAAIANKIVAVNRNEDIAIDYNKVVGTVAALEMEALLLMQRMGKRLMLLQ